MSGRPPDPDFLDPGSAGGPVPHGDGLAGALEAFLRVVDGVDREPGSDAVRRAEQLVRDRLQACGWRPPARRNTSCRPIGTGAGCAADGFARGLADRLADAERDSAALAERLQQALAAPDVVGAAQRCHALVGEALVLGAVELALRLGVDGDDLPR